MQTAQFPASAASTLIEGYCEDFASLSSILAQTLEQVSMRGLSLGKSGERLGSLEQGMRDLADAIHELLVKQPTAKPTADAGGKDPKKVAQSNTLQPAAAGGGIGQAAGHTAGLARRAVGPGAHAEPAPARPPATATAPSAATPAAPAAPAPATTAATRRSADASLRGTNQSMPLLSVVQFIGRTRKSGVLKIDLGNGHINFRFSEGSVCATEASHCPESERLGDVLVDLGFCKRADIDTLMRGACDEPGKRLGDLILSTGLVSSGQIVEALETQVQRRFQRACKTPAATYEFSPGPRVAGDGRIMISSFELTYEANRATRRS